MAADRSARAAGAAMGTSALVVVHEDDAGLLDGAMQHIHDLERRWSRFIADSEISILNRSADVPVIVSPDTFRVIRAALEAAVATAGRFDPTVHETMRTLGYDRTFDAIAPDGPVPRGAATVAPGPAAVELDDALHAVTLRNGAALDLGGIGKGTAADLVTGRLLERGARGAAVSLGGDLRVRGESPAGNGWRITHDGVPLEVAPLDDGGVCTSTISRRRWTTTTGPVHHLVDPRTGEPTDGDIESVTVIGATAQQAEVLTKAAMVAGSDAPALLRDHGVTAFIRWAAAA